MTRLKKRGNIRDKKRWFFLCEIHLWEQKVTIASFPFAYNLCTWSMESVKRGLKQNADELFLKVHWSLSVSYARIIFEADFSAEKRVIKPGKRSSWDLTPKVLFYERGRSAGLSRENRKKLVEKVFFQRFDRFKKFSYIIRAKKSRLFYCSPSCMAQKLFSTHIHTYEKVTKRSRNFVAG